MYIITYMVQISNLIVFYILYKVSTDVIFNISSVYYLLKWSAKLSVNKFIDIFLIAKKKQEIITEDKILDVSPPNYEDIYFIIDE